MARRRKPAPRRGKSNGVHTYHAVVALILGLASVLAPAPLLLLLGLEADPGARLMLQLLGVAQLGMGLLAWLTRSAGESEVLRAVEVSFFVTFGIGLAVTLLAQTSGVTNEAGWALLALNLGPALGYGYRLLRRSAFR